MSEIPEWAVGTGVDTDMKGDPRPGAQAGTRFWMPRATSKKIVFLTEGTEALGLWEHQFRMGGKYTNWLSCLEPMRLKCHLCEWAAAHEGQFSRGKILVFSIIDCEEFTTRAGETKANVVKLLCAKSQTAELLKRKYLSQLEEGRGLKGAMFQVYRSNEPTSPSVGNDYEYKKHVDLDTFPDATPLDAAKLLAPDPDAVLAAIRRIAAEAGEGPASEASTDVDVDY